MADNDNMFIVITQDGDGGGIFYLGCYANIEEAWGCAMVNIWDFSNSYREDGEKFEIGLPYRLEGDAGYGIKITYRAKSWKKAKFDYYFILFGELKEAVKNLTGGKHAD